MILAQVILISIGALLTDAQTWTEAQECNCKCYRTDVCEELANFTRWNKYFDFVRLLEKDWQNQIAHVVRQQTEVGVNEKMESLKNTIIAPQQNLSRPMEILIARVGSLEASLRTLQERSKELDLTMELMSDQMIELRNELRRNGPACNPTTWEIGSQSMDNNVCNCTPENGCQSQSQSQNQCGVDFDIRSRNGGGSLSNSRMWPWMAAIYRRGTEHICDGSVIHQKFVLTSAWCVKWYGTVGLSVKLGLSDLKDWSHLQEYEVRKVHTHPKFENGRYGNYDYNIALLELDKPISFDGFVRPICLPPKEISWDESLIQPRSGVNTVDLGSYMQATSNTFSTVLNSTILTPAECRRQLKEMDWEKYFPSPDLSFCAESSSAACPYRGSPVMQSSQERGGARMWTQVGIMGYISECKIFFSPRLDRLRTWVDETIESASKEGASAVADEW